MIDAYRTDRKKEFYDELERLAAEEEAAELELTAQDLDLCSKADEANARAEEAKVRLRARGYDSEEKECREEAKVFVDELLQGFRNNAEKKKERRKQLFGRIKEIGKYTAKWTAITAAAAAVIGGPVYATAYYWNTRDEALAALAKYDQPVKITDPQERVEVISQLDEIFEEHAEDWGSDEAAARYLAYIEEKGLSISEGARMLDNIGKWVYVDADNINLANSVYQYNLFLEANKISSDVGECLLKKRKTSSSMLIIRLDASYKAGNCKNQ